MRSDTTAATPERSVLVSGIGIAGPTLAYWLKVYGFQTKLVEIAPHLRTGGYVIDFWGRGFDVAAKMGIIPDIKHEGYDVEELRLVNSKGRRVGGFNADVFRSATNNRYVSIPRGELAKIIYQKIESRCEALFGDSVREVDQDEGRVRVTFEHSEPRRFEAGWECPQILAAMDASSDIYFDRVSQIRMGTWSQGRVALVGDAAFCPSLLAGQGSSLAMIGAYVLAGELSRTANHPRKAFQRYEQQFGAFIAGKQDAAVKLSASFAPKTHWGIFFRNQITKAFRLPFVTKLAMGPSLLERIDLPDYPGSVNASRRVL